MKKCSKCSQELSFEKFGKNRARPDGLAHWCKGCARASNKRYYAANTSAARNATRRWNAKNAQRKLEKQRQWLANNPQFESAYRKKRRDLGLDLDAQREQHSKRRAVCRKATPAWADKAEIRKIYQTARELSAISGFNFEVDHVVPLVSPLVCGLHVACNMQVLADFQNRKKGNRTWPDMP